MRNKATDFRLTYHCDWDSGLIECSQKFYYVDNNNAVVVALDAGMRHFGSKTILVNGYFYELARDLTIEGVIRC